MDPIEELHRCLGQQGKQSLPRAANISELWHGETPQLRQHYGIQGSNDLIDQIISFICRRLVRLGRQAPRYMRGGGRSQISMVFFSELQTTDMASTIAATCGGGTRHPYMLFSLQIQDLLGGSNTIVSHSFSCCSRY